HRRLTHEAVSDRHDSQKRETSAQDRVRPAGLMREARNDPADRNAGCKCRQPGPPPCQVGSLIRQMGPAGRVARLVELTAAGRADVSRRAHGGDYTERGKQRPDRDPPLRDRARSGRTRIGPLLLCAKAAAPDRARSPRGGSKQALMETVGRYLNPPASLGALLG